MEIEHHSTLLSFYNLKKIKELTLKLLPTLQHFARKKDGKLKLDVVTRVTKEIPPLKRKSFHNLLLAPSSSFNEAIFF